MFQSNQSPCTVSTFYLTGGSHAPFLNELVTSLLAPVLQSDAQPRSRAAAVPSWLTGEGLDAFLESLRPEIERTAYALYFHHGAKPCLDAQDIIQEGMIAAWRATNKYDASKVVDERSFRGYCMKRARGAMLNCLAREGRDTAISLDDYTTNGSDNTPLLCHEIADTGRPRRQATITERRRILAALRTLSPKERCVVMAYYRIDGRNGYSPSLCDIQRRLRMTNSTMYGIRARALKKLAATL